MHTCRILWFLRVDLLSLDAAVFCRFWLGLACSVQPSFMLSLEWRTPLRLSFACSTWCTEIRSLTRLQAWAKLTFYMQQSGTSSGFGLGSTLSSISLLLKSVSATTRWRRKTKPNGCLALQTTQASSRKRRKQTSKPWLCHKHWRIKT